MRAPEFWTVAMVSVVVLQTLSEGMLLASCVLGCVIIHVIDGAPKAKRRRRKLTNSKRAV